MAGTPTSLTQRTLYVLASAQPELDTSLVEQFARDLTCSFDAQTTALDLEDIEQVFARLKEPILGCCVASDAGAATQAALAGAVRPGSPCQVALVVCAFPPGGVRMRAIGDMFAAAQAQLAQQTFLIFGAYQDQQLGQGAVRVSALTG